jgi:hypothetical protein
VTSFLLRTTRILCACAVALVLAACLPGGAASDPWQKGANWTSFRIGYAKSLDGGAPNGMGGGGFGFSRMLSDRVSLGFFVHYELLGKFGDAAQIEIPATAEYALHFRWKTALRPYVGVGVGGFYHKITRSGSPRADLLPGTIFKFGADSPLDDHNVLGLDARVASVGTDDEILDPVFGRASPRSIRWSVKLSYARVF